MSTLTQHLQSLPNDKLKILFNNMLDAGIGHELNNDTKRVFKRLRKESSGKTKKIYAALSKCDKSEYEILFSIFIENLN